MAIVVSPGKTKKWTAVFPDGHKVSFGAKGYSDYTMHKDPERMRRYIMRHQKHENWSNKYTAGFWSRWLLWSEPSLNAARRKVESILKTKVIIKKA
jgi:Family of unknown function (DUF5754)